MSSQVSDFHAGIPLEKLRARHLTKTVFTLGPAASDSARVASLVAPSVRLLPSFPEVMRTALEQGAVALICCGFKDSSSTWVDLHFQYLLEMQCYCVFLTQTMPMALARRRGARGNTIAIHPATERLLSRQPFSSHLPGELEIHRVGSKPCGVEGAAFGLFDYCVGSLPNIERYSELESLAVVQPNMAWALYERTS